MIGVSHYAEMVREARRQRRLVDGGLTDWVIVRNRLSTLGSRNKRLVGEGVNQLARQLGFRSTDGFAERVVYREFFPRGLTALDDINEDTLGQRPTVSHVTARDEVKALIDDLEAADRRARQAARRRPCRMARGCRKAARDPRPARRLRRALPRPLRVLPVSATLWRGLEASREGPSMSKDRSDRAPAPANAARIDDQTPAASRAEIDAFLEPRQRARPRG